MWVGVFILLGLAIRRGDGTMGKGLRMAFDFLLMMFPRMIVALALAGFAAELLPAAVISDWLGEESGIKGILIASVAGIFVPAGGVVAFPLALAMLRIGVGLPQLVAFLTAWEIFAIHRILAFEIPFLGRSFVLLRLTSSCMLAPLAGLLAYGLLGIFPDWGGKP
jgi:uncharacterized membrane protein YraQ (UPF0718 family)